MATKPENAWIMRVPVISTRHIQESTMRAITEQDENLPTVACPTPWGAFVGVGQTEQDDANLEYPDLFPVFTWAERSGYEWVRFDAEGDDIDDLPVYEWR